jgi:uncharacterized protein YkwD
LVAIGFLAISACAAPTPVDRAIPSAPAPTASVRDFRQIESQVFTALNAARTRPGTAAGWLEDLLPRFNGTRLSRPNWPFAIQTVEGAGAVREAIDALKRQAPVAALTLDASLSRAAADHVSDQARTGAVGHTGSDGSTVSSRVERYVRWIASINENIDYSPMVSGRDVIESLIIDDGVGDRGHRRNIFDPSSRVVGIACGPHPRYTAACVIVQAGGVASR